MDKLLLISPHLSTGGLPQFVLNKIEILNKIYDIYCVEYSFLSPDYVIQRNKIINILGEKFIELGEDKSNLINIIERISPNIISIEEFPETFIEVEILDYIYSNNRRYKILETTHSSNDMSNIKRWLPDKFIFVSDYSKEIYSHFEIESEVIEYPIDKKIVNKEEAQERLMLDPEYKHILNVGLFTPGKNQKYAFEIAKRLINEKVIFHFVGNTAINFKEYWEPLIEETPSNCVVWGERDDVDTFIQACDLFLFTSKFELNPLVIKEVLAYEEIPIFMFNLETYMDKYNDKEIITYLTGKIKIDKDFISNKLNLNEKNKSDDTISLILTHPNNIERKNILKECVEFTNSEIAICSNYPVDSEIQHNCDWLLYTKENLLLSKDDFNKYNLTSYIYKYVDGDRIETEFDFDHSYAVYNLIKRGLYFCKSINKDKVHIINYDYLISKSTLEENEKLLSEYDIIFYRYEDKVECEKYSTGFISARIDAILNFFDFFTKTEDYFNYDPFLIEGKIFSFYSKENLKIKELSFNKLESEDITDRTGIVDYTKF